MSDIQTITWRQLTGNKFVTTINTAMLSEAGYVKQQSIRQIGGELPKVFYVVYDEDYLLQILLRKVIRPLSVLNKEKVQEIIDNAWVLYDKELLTPCGLSENNF